MKRYNITTCKTYQSQGQEKKSWPQVGTLVYFEAGNGKSEGYKLELNMFPGIQFYVFEQKPPESRGTDAEPAVSIDADTRAVRPASKGVGSGAKSHTPAVIPPGGARMSDDQINYPENDISAEEIPF